MALLKQAQLNDSAKSLMNPYLSRQVQSSLIGKMGAEDPYDQGKHGK